MKNGDVKLGDVMLHDALFEAYPDIADITVSFSYMRKSDNGYFSPSENRIVINESMKDNRDALMNTLLHEVQHVIQHKEGFTRGTNTDYWSDTEKQSRAKELYQERYDTIWESLTDEERSLYEEYKTLNDKWLDFYTDPAEMETLEAEMEEKGRELSRTDWFLKLEKLETAVKGISPANLYLATAGEQEARNVAKRRTMTEEERKNSPPFTGNESTVFAEDAQTSLYTDHDADGEPVTVISSGQDAFKGAPESSYAKIARRIILNQFRGKILPLSENDLARVTSKSAGEYAYPAVQMPVDSSEYAAKAKAAPELDNLLANSTYLEWKPDSKLHPHILAEYGWDYYQTTFVVDGKVFQGEITIANSEKGRVFYDITEIKEVSGTSGKYVALLARSSSTSGNFTASVSNYARGVKSENTSRINMENTSRINMDADTETGASYATGYQEWVPDFDELHARNKLTAEEREEMLTGLLTDPGAKKGYCSYQIGDIQADNVRNESTGWSAWINGQTVTEDAESLSAAARQVMQALTDTEAETAARSEGKLCRK